MLLPAFQTELPTIKDTAPLILEVLSFLTDRLGLTKKSVIVDVGSGTGIFSELFLKNGNSVYGVEPNPEMRRSAEIFLEKYPGFKSIHTPAENTGLPNRLADFVTAAQAFHWFDQTETKKEFQRILKPDGYIILIWNSRKELGSSFQTDYEALIEKFGTDYHLVKHSNIKDNELHEFLGERNYGSAQFPNFQELDFDGLKGRLTSTSYMPNQTHPRYPSMCEALKELFNKYQHNGKIKILYDTNLYFAMN